MATRIFSCRTYSFGSTINMLSMQVSPGVWPAHGTEINLKISQRMSGMARRGEEGAQQGSTPLLREKGEHPPMKDTTGTKKEKRSRSEAGMLQRGCWGEWEDEPGAAGMEHVSSCVCPGSRASNSKALHSESQGQELPKILADVSGQQSRLSKPALDLTRPEKSCNSLQLLGFAFCLF